MLPSPDDPRAPRPEFWSREPERWLAAIVESSEDAIIGKTLDSVIRSWNAGASRIFGYTADEIVGRSVLTLIPPECHSEEREIVSRLARGERINNFETVRLRKGGGRIDISLSVSPIRDRDGQIVGAAKIARDITEANRLRRAERELAEQLQEQAIELEQQIDHSRNAQLSAEEASHAKSIFLRTMSHELRTPLNAIAGYVELMTMELRGPLTAQQRSDLVRIRANQQLLLRLIDDVLDLAKLESGRLEYRITDVRIDDLLHTLEAYIAPALETKGLAYEFIACGSHAIARADIEKVEQIMINLLSNAAKFTERGRITVHCATLDEWLDIQVVDTGRGIRPEFLERIFEPFVQADQKLTRSAEGTGLGLAISRGLARGMGGDVLASSEPGKGSTFTLRLRRAKPVA